MKRLKISFAVAMLALASTFARDTPILNGKLTSDLNANGNAVTSLKEPSAESDAATKKYVDAATADAGKVQSVNSQTGAVVLAASDVGAVATNDFSAATNALAEAIAKAEPGNYAAVSNAAMTALQPAATNGLVTASVTNGLASAASVSASIASATNGLASLASLTPLSSQIAANTTAIATKADAANVYSKADIEAKGYLTAESDPAFAAWTNDTSVIAGEDAKAPYGDAVALGKSANADGNRGVAIGFEAYADTDATAIGQQAYAPEVATMGVKYLPSKIYLGTSSMSKRKGKSLQSYLDERATTNALAATDANVAANADAISAVSDELGSKAKRYALVASASASISAADGNLYALTADTNGVAVTLPAALADYAQDFVLRVVAADTNGTQIAQIANVNIDLPNGDVFANGSLKGTNYVTFTQTTANPATWSIGYFSATKEEE